MVRNRRPLEALISTEFIFVFPIALTVILAIMGFGFTGYQRARIDYSLAHLADRLPAGWDSMDADTLVKKLVSASADIDPSYLTVKNASVTIDSDENLGHGNAVAGDLGTENLRTEDRAVTVSAEITYDYPAPYNVFGKRSVRNITRSYISYSDWEVI